LNIISDKYHTKYPIVLIHGAGFRDRKYLNYWGRIPKVLTNNGCSIFYGHQESWATIENNAIIIKNSIKKIIEETGAEKVNLIAHSKGGLESRFVISSLNMSAKIASLTTIATPHHGSKTMDIIYKLPKVLFRLVSVFANLWFRMLGDENPDFHNVCGQFTTYFAEKFNNENPDSADVYYQSYAAVMNNSFSDMFMFIPHFVVNLVEGENDGLVTPKSAEWSNFRGAFRGSTNRGISHADEVDMRRTRLSRKISSEGVNDICDVYCEIVAKLKCSGY
jgi:triacylglycerol lipase